MGMPIAFALCITGFLGIMYTIDFSAAITQLGLVPYSTVSRYIMSIIPLFTFMGSLVFNSGIVMDLYKVANKWLGVLPGGLAIGTIAGCTGFGAVSGSAVAAVGLMTETTLPEMLRYRYSPGLASGCIAAGATLGILVPPSGPMVVYGILSEASIGKLLIAGIIPGILLAVFYALIVYIRCRLNPELGPRGDSTTIRDKVYSLASIWPAILLAGAVIGGIWGGIFTPIEAAGVGSFLSLALCLMKKKLNRKNLLEALISSIRSSAMIFSMFIGAQLFSYFLNTTRAPQAIGQYMANLQVPPSVIIIGIMAIYFIYGCVMDEAGLMMISLPIFLPIIKALGFDVIVFGVLVIVVMGAGMFMPPIGLNCFIIANIAEKKYGISLSTIYRGVLPFCIANITLILLLIFFPSNALFLPSLM